MAENIKKLGFVVKSSDRKKSPGATKRRDKSKSFPEQPKLLAVLHYHQRPGCHPTPATFKNGEQCFELVTSGRGWVEIKGKWIEVNPGDLLWHRPGDWTIGRSDFQHPYSCLAVRFYDPAMKLPRVPRITRWEELDEVKRFTGEVVRLHADDS